MASSEHAVEPSDEPKPRNGFEAQLGRTVEFLAHTVAAFIGFVGLGLIALAAGLLVKWVTPFASAEVIDVLHYVELGLLYGDFLLFGVVFVLGLLEFLSGALAETVEVAKNQWSKP
jgi:hypothetical protein